MKEGVDFSWRQDQFLKSFLQNEKRKVIPRAPT